MSSDTVTADDCFWTVSNSELASDVSSGPHGLSSQEAAARLAHYGPNDSVTTLPRSLLIKIGRRLIEPLTAILLLAALITGIMGDRESCIIIIVILTSSIALDLFQVQRAEAAVDALRKSVAVTAQVRRDGQYQTVLVRDIVPGDVVQLKAGGLVPADGVVLTSHGARTNESILTGEPYAVEKRAGPSSGTLPADAFNALFNGTCLVNGAAEMLVVRTGARTRFGEISSSLQDQEAPTAFEQGLHALGVLILRLTGFLVLFVVLVQVSSHRFSLDSFLFAVALAVGLTPELLPMIVTVTLSKGAVYMARRKVIVKRLSAIHDLGAMDILCTDKTGTLTEASIAYDTSFDCDGHESAAVETLLYLNCKLSRYAHNEMDDAVLKAAAPVAEDNYLDAAPFDFERRRSSVLVARAGVPTIITKGTPESLVLLCSKVQHADGSVRPMDEAAKTRLKALVEDWGAQGYRLLAVAWRAMPDGRTTIDISDECDLVLAGFASFLDPPKASAKDAIRELAEAGVNVKIISGDAKPVVRHLLEVFGNTSPRIISGDELEQMNAPALEACVTDVDAFVRMSPDQKMRIVRALRRRGHTVGFLGDGINDAPAIHAADVGISVDTGTDVARAAADIILLAPDLGVLNAGIKEGRRTYANIMKYIRMAASSNFGNMLSMAFASLLLPFLPLTPLQILLNNLLYDVSETGIPFDRVDKTDVETPHAWDMRSILLFTLVMGALSSLFDIATFALLHLVFHLDVAAFRTAWFVESIASQILVIFVIRTVLSPLKSRPHKMLTLTSLGTLGAALVIALTPLGALAQLVPLPGTVITAMAAMVGAYLLSAEAVKRLGANWLYPSTKTSSGTEP